MIKKPRGFRGIAVLLAAAISVSPAAVPVHAEEITSSCEEFSEYTVLEDSESAKDTTSAITNSEHEEAESVICSSDSTREVNVPNDEMLQIINEKIEHENMFSHGYWTNESGQNGYLFDITYHSTGNAYPHIINGVDWSIYDNLDIHAVYDESTGVTTIYVSINTTPENGTPDTVARQSTQISNASSILSEAKKLSCPKETYIVFEKGITEIGENFATRDSIGASKVICPESCTVFGDHAFAGFVSKIPQVVYENRVRYKKYSHPEFELKSNEITYIGKNAFYIKDAEGKSGYPIISMPKQTKQIEIGYGGLKHAQMLDYKLNMPESYGKNSEYGINGNMYASYYNNVSLHKEALAQEFIILGENIVDMTEPSETGWNPHWLTDSYNATSLPYTYPSDYDGSEQTGSIITSVIIYEGKNPFEMPGKNESWGYEYTHPFQIEVASCIYLYPEKYADTYPDSTGSGSDVAVAYSGTLDELCSGGELYNYLLKGADMLAINAGYKKAPAAGNDDDNNNHSNPGSGDDPTPAPITSDTGYTTTTLNNIQYTGKKIKLDSVLSITDSDGNCYSGKEIKVKYKNNKNAGTATYSITGLKGNGISKEAKNKIKQEYTGKTFTFEITPRKLNASNVEITSKDGKIKSVKWILDGKKKKVSKKMWTLDGTTIKFSGNFEGSVDASQYVGGSGDSGSNS